MANQIYSNIVLTETDRAILSSYKRMCDGLSDYLGSGYEFVLHSLEDLDHSVIKIINGHYTSRKEGSPITDLAWTKYRRKISPDTFPIPAVTGRASRCGPQPSPLSARTSVLSVCCASTFI